jgi:hypothetical protein
LQALNELMRRRFRFGVGPLTLAVWPAILLLGVGATASVTGVVGPDVRETARAHAPAFQLAPQFEVRPDCPVIIVDPGGACPVPPIATQARVSPATISLCVESLCGRGFRPGDTVLLLATRAEGSTFWRIRADPKGNFRSPLPSPLCRFAPIDLAAHGNHGERSNRLAVGSVGCLVFGP